MVVTTSIGVSHKLKDELKSRKLIKEEPFESVIWRLIKNDPKSRTN